MVVGWSSSYCLWWCAVLHLIKELGSCWTCQLNDELPRTANTRLQCRLKNHGTTSKKSLVIYLRAYSQRH